MNKIMKRILVSVLAIAMVLGSVSGSAMTVRAAEKTAQDIQNSIDELEGRLDEVEGYIADVEAEIDETLSGTEGNLADGQTAKNNADAQGANAGEAAGVANSEKDKAESSYYSGNAKKYANDANEAAQNAQAAADAAAAEAAKAKEAYEAALAAYEKALAAANAENKNVNDKYADAADEADGIVTDAAAVKAAADAAKAAADKALADAQAVLAKENEKLAAAKDAAEAASDKYDAAVTKVQECVQAAEAAKKAFDDYVKGELKDANDAKTAADGVLANKQLLWDAAKETLAAATTTEAEKKAAAEAAQTAAENAQKEADRLAGLEDIDEAAAKAAIRAAKDAQAAADEAAQAAADAADAAVKAAEALATAESNLETAKNEKSAADVAQAVAEKAKEVAAAAKSAAETALAEAKAEKAAADEKKIETAAAVVAAKVAVAAAEEVVKTATENSLKTGAELLAAEAALGVGKVAVDGLDLVMDGMEQGKEYAGQAMEQATSQMDQVTADKDEKETADQNAQTTVEAAQAAVEAAAQKLAEATAAKEAAEALAATKYGEAITALEKEIAEAVDDATAATKKQELIETVLQYGQSTDEVKFTDINYVDTESKIYEAVDADGNKQYYQFVEYEDGTYSFFACEKNETSSIIDRKEDAADLSKVEGLEEWQYDVVELENGKYEIIYYDINGEEVYKSEADANAAVAGDKNKEVFEKTVVTVETKDKVDVTAYDIPEKPETVNKPVDLETFLKNNNIDALEEEPKFTETEPTKPGADSDRPNVKKPSRFDSKYWNGLSFNESAYNADVASYNSIMGPWVEYDKAKKTYDALKWTYDTVTLPLWQEAKDLYDKKTASYQDDVAKYNEYLEKKAAYEEAMEPVNAENATRKAALVEAYKAEGNVLTVVIDGVERTVAYSDILGFYLTDASLSEIFFDIKDYDVTVTNTNTTYHVVAYNETVTVAYEKLDGASVADYENITNKVAGANSEYNNATDAKEVADQNLADAQAAKDATGAAYEEALANYEEKKRIYDEIEKAYEYYFANEEKAFDIPEGAANLLKGLGITDAEKAVKTLDSLGVLDKLGIDADEVNITLTDDNQLVFEIPNSSKYDQHMLALEVAKQLAEQGVKEAEKLVEEKSEAHSEAVENLETAGKELAEVAKDLLSAEITDGLTDLEVAVLDTKVKEALAIVEATGCADDTAAAVLAEALLLVATKSSNVESAVTEKADAEAAKKAADEAAKTAAAKKAAADDAKELADYAVSEASAKWREARAAEKEAQILADQYGADSKTAQKALEAAQKALGEAEAAEADAKQAQADAAEAQDKALKAQQDAQKKADDAKEKWGKAEDTKAAEISTRDKLLQLAEDAQKLALEVALAQADADKAEKLAQTAAEEAATAATNAADAKDAADLAQQEVLKLQNSANVSASALADAWAIVEELKALADAADAVATAAQTSANAANDAYEAAKARASQLYLNEYIAMYEALDNITEETVIEDEEVPLASMSNQNDAAGIAIVKIEGEEHVYDMEGEAVAMTFSAFEDAEEENVYHMLFTNEDGKIMKNHFIVEYEDGTYEILTLEEFAEKTDLDWDVVFVYWASANGIITVSQEVELNKTVYVADENGVLAVKEEEDEE